MTNLSCNEYAQAVLDVVARAEQIRREKGFNIPRTIVECRDEKIQITRRVFLEDTPDPFEIFIQLKIDDLVSFSALFSGRLDIYISANDLEQLLMKLISLNQTTPLTLSLYNWVVSIDPHTDYTNIDVNSRMSLYVTRKDSIARLSPQIFASIFLQAMIDLDNVIVSIYDDNGSQNDDDDDDDDSQ